MVDHFRDYRWQDGLPVGVEKVSQGDLHGCEWSYAIPRDPYGKRYSVEAYRYGCFRAVIYDSGFLDFRKLQPEAQTAWERLPLENRKGWFEQACLVRDENGRALCMEYYRFESELCRNCYLTTPQGIPICRHSLYYEKLGDTWNGLILRDATDRTVIRKCYSCDEEGHFGSLLSQQTSSFERIF